MGTRKQREKQEDIWIAHTELPSAPGQQGPAIEPPCGFDGYPVMEQTSLRAGVASAEVQRLSRRTVTTVDHPLSPTPPYVLVAPVLELACR